MYPQSPAEGTRRYWAAEHPARQARRAAVREAAIVQIGELSDRELLIAGAIAYWCELNKAAEPRTQRVCRYRGKIPAGIVEPRSR